MSGRKRKLTAEQHRQLAARNATYMRLRIEAAKHSRYQLCKEFGISESAFNNYLRRPLVAEF